jgi:repressor of nif and glnA expression
MSIAKHLRENGQKLLSSPNAIHIEVLDACGMTKKHRILINTKMQKTEEKQEHTLLIRKLCTKLSSMHPSSSFDSLEVDGNPRHDSCEAFC